MTDLNMYWLFTLICVICCAISIACVVMVRDGKKKPDLSGVVEVASKGLEGADKITDVLRAVFPLSLPLTVADKVIDYAKYGVKKAEQLYNSKEITKDDRKDSASKFVYQALELAQVEVTPEIRKLVDGSVEAAVYAMKHAGTAEL